MPPGTYRGRFAPSPTGDLHFGSLIAAVASYLQAASQSGEWLVRIDDIDPPRQVSGSAERILRDLARMGMRPSTAADYQSTRLVRFRAARDRLLDSGRAFHCGCTRADMPADGAYPGTCRNGIPRGKQARSVRLKTEARAIEFEDAVQGGMSADLSRDQGDFVIWRADDLPSYQLATAMDDAAPGVTEVVRGADLLESTFRQIAVRRALGLACPGYAHVPVATRDGEKLSKRLGSDPVAGGDPVAAVSSALDFLGQGPPKSGCLEELWSWARRHWDLSRVPACLAREAP
ncbi:MAG: tRNA glutamyl-Q(34) synthetase GluQRS [Xanthomonadales bacterium]|nr:tRNA glutamyl-Q(34) synthetase GluQRS [Xanthomonadales bacterium]